MLKGILAYLRGTVVAELVTAEPGAALTYYASRGIALRDPVLTAPLTLRLTMSPGQWRRLSKLAEQRGDRCRALRRWGLGVTFARCRRRLPFWLALGLLCGLVLYAPQRVWFVEVEGNQTVPAREILAAAEECGVSFWAKSGEIRSEKVKNQLLNLIPELQWAGVNFSGGVATVCVRERLEAEPVRDRSGITNVVAARDGIVVSMSVLGGQAVCQVGQAVREGELLITGCVDHEHCTQYTHADGEVYALTRRQTEAVYPAQWSQKVYTGRVWQCYSLVAGRKIINLRGNSGISQGTCDKMTEIKYLPLPGDYHLPVYLLVETYREYTLVSCTLEPEESLAVLTAFSRAQTQGEMLAGEILGEEPVFRREEAVYVLTTTFSCREMIARQRPVKLFEGETTNEYQ